MHNRCNLAAEALYRLCERQRQVCVNALQRKMRNDRPAYRKEVRKLIKPQGVRRTSEGYALAETLATSIVTFQEAKKRRREGMIRKREWCRRKKEKEECGSETASEYWRAAVADPDGGKDMIETLRNNFKFAHDVWLPPAVSLAPGVSQGPSGPVRPGAGEGGRGRVGPRPGPQSPNWIYGAIRPNAPEVFCKDSEGSQIFATATLLLQPWPWKNAATTIPGAVGPPWGLGSGPRAPRLGPGPRAPGADDPIPP